LGLKCSYFDWESGFPEQNSLLFKLQGEAISTSTYLLGLTQRLVTDNSLDLVFTNFSRVSIFFADASFVKPGLCHPPIGIEIPLDLQNSASYYEHFYRKYIRIY
jgi:hypothetical protein